MANVIANVNCPTLIISHNKTLAAQLYGEFKAFFPNNAVEYFVSYYDYYQPEAYLPATDTYIEKDLAINSEIEKLRLSATSQLLSGRNDIGKTRKNIRPPSGKTRRSSFDRQLGRKTRSGRVSRPCCLFL